MARLGVNRKDKNRDSLLLERKPLVDECNGCERVDGDKCEVYLYPEKKWEKGKCCLATHIKTEESKKQKFVNPIKKSKRARK